MKHARFAPQGLLAIKPDAYGMTMYYDGEPKRAVEIKGNCAIVNIEGALVHHRDYCFDSYDDIKCRVGEACATEAKIVLLNIDSPGGLVAGVFDTSREIRAMCARAGKPLWCYIDSEASSAAYGLACAAEKIFIPESGITGSIGVIAMPMDCTKADAMMGLRFEAVTSGSRKADGNPHTPLTEDAIVAIQETVMAQAEPFWQLVAESRGISPKSVAAFDCRVFVGQQAIDARLADEMSTFDAVIDLASKFDASKPVAKASAKVVTKATSQSTSSKTSATRSSKMDMEEIRKALSKYAEGDGEDAKKAKKALALLDIDTPEEEKKEKDMKDDKSDESEDAKKAKAEEEAKKAKAEEEAAAEKKSEDDAEEEAKAARSGLALASRVQALESEIQEKKDKEERASLMASRPDFSPEVVKFLETQNLKTLRAACTGPAKLPLGSGRPNLAAAAQSDVRPTVGQGEGHGTVVQQGEQMSEKEMLDMRMGIKTPGSTIKFDGITHSTGVMTREQAQEFLAKRKAEQK
jgi:capsid assembly protease